jgi:hypothetical protein
VSALAAAFVIHLSGRVSVTAVYPVVRDLYFAGVGARPKGGLLGEAKRARAVACDRGQNGRARERSVEMRKELSVPRRRRR